MLLHLHKLCKRRFHNNAGCDTLLELYTTLVRPHLEYAASVWNPYTASNVNKLEDTQKFALRICSKQWNLGYQELLDLTCLSMLENRRLYFKMCTLYKIVYNLIYFPPDVITPKLNSTALLPLLHQPFYFTNLSLTPLLTNHPLYHPQYHYGITCRTMLYCLHLFLLLSH